MRWFFMNRNDFNDTLRVNIEELVRKTITTCSVDIKRIYDAIDLSEEVKKLTQQVSTLEIKKSKIEEDFAKERREIEHKLGLEKNRQKQELELGLREQQIKLREENLKADRDRFEANMKFMNDRFSTEVGYLKDMITKLVPTTTVKITEER